MLERSPVHARSARIGASQFVSVSKNVRPTNLVVDVEAEGGLRLRLTVKLSLKAPDPLGVAALIANQPDFADFESTPEVRALPSTELPGLTCLGSEEAPNEEPASVRRTNRTYSFPVSGFHERAFAICSEGTSETRLTSLNFELRALRGILGSEKLKPRVMCTIRVFA